MCRLGALPVFPRPFSSKPLAPSCEREHEAATLGRGALPTSWGKVLPVTPGTKYVTLGGAIANDIHGKNHHVAGTFGCHVPEFELVRSDGTHLRCSATENPDWYAATIGGLGLTGVITWARLKMKPIVSRKIEQTPDRMHWKWSVIGERNWSRATASAGRLTLAQTYPLNTPTRSDGTNIWECDLTAERSGASEIRWTTVLHGIDGTTVQDQGVVPSASV